MDGRPHEGPSFAFRGVLRANDLRYLERACVLFLLFSVFSVVFFWVFVGVDSVGLFVWCGVGVIFVAIVVGVGRFVGIGCSW